MTDPTMLCPTVEKLKSLIDGTLPIVQQDACQSHVDACVACQQRLESLVAGSESWDAALRHLRNGASRLEETVLSEAVRQMKVDEFVEVAASAPNSVNPLTYLTPSDQPGSLGKLGMYEVTEVIGQGGMGVVLKAFDPELHRVVAVKVLAPYLAHNPLARKRFVREAQAIAAVSHDHVITIHAIDPSIEQPKIVMQFVSGRSLQQKIDAEGALDLKEILRIGMQTAAGLSAAHAQGLVHRDVKPSNILLENGVQRVKLTDFGLARAVDDASLTQSGAIAGTPQYMAPEQANGDAVDHRADLFSLGSVIYAMCVGHSPFRASTTMGVLKRVCHDPPRPIQELNPDIPDWLCAIVIKLLAKKPEDRFSTAKSVAELLEKWLAHVQQPTVVARPPLVSNNESSSRSSDTGANRSPAPNLPSSRSRHSPKSDIFARTIFFQPVTFRLVLFYFLLGTATCMAFMIRNSRNTELFEVMVVSTVPGMFFCFFAIMLTSLVRFFQANFRRFRSWRTGSNSDDVASPLSADASNEPGRLLGVAPESVAMIAAIGVVLFTRNPLIAAIVAVVVWRISLARSPAKEWIDQADSQSAGNSIENSEKPASAFYESERAKRGLGWGISDPQVDRNDRSLEFRERERADRTVQFRHFFSHPFETIKRVITSVTADGNPLLLSIGWFFVGGIDLAYGIALFSNMFPMPLFWITMCVLSLAVSVCIQARQNSGFIQCTSYIGLLPLSVGAIGRIPLGILTLMWLNRPDIQASFGRTAFRETIIGGPIVGLLTLCRRSLAAAGWIAVWTTLWGGVLAFIIWSLVIPYGPSTYHITEKSRVVLKGHPNAHFYLESFGSGASVGLYPPMQAGHPYRRQEVHVGFSNPDFRQGLRVQLGVPPVNLGTYRVLSRSDVEELFTAVFNQSYPEHAADLFQAIQQLSVDEGFATTDASATSTTPVAKSDRARVIEYIQQRHNDHVGIQPGFVRIGSMLDPTLFDVQLDAGTGFYSNPALWLLVSGSIASVAIWLLVSGWIVRDVVFSESRRILALCSRLRGAVVHVFV